MNAEEAVARLAKRDLRLAVAESCTGGLLGGRITDVVGASRVFLGGIIAYGNDVKAAQLGVDASLFTDGHGAVSATVAEAMAEGVRRRLGADIGIGVSGVAGPGGGTEEKPVGTVWIACVGPDDIVSVERIQAQGDRRAVREAAVDASLAILAQNLDA